MEQQPPDSPAARSAPAAPLNPPSEPPIRAHWTPAKQRIFLAALLETGSIARAARAAAMSRSSAHRLRLRLTGTRFDAMWDEVLALHASRMADPFGERQPLGPERRGTPPVAAKPRR